MSVDKRQNQTETGRSNPLTYYAVLQNLLMFDNSSKSILRNRLVCKSWREANEGGWRRLDKTLVLRYSELQASSKKACTQKQLMTLSEFQIEKQNLDTQPMGLIPPKKMNLHNWEKFPGDLRLSDLDSWFWSVTATSCLTRLTLTDCQFREDVPIYKQLFLEGLPNLESLELRNCVVYKKALQAVNRQDTGFFANFFSWQNVETRYQHRRLRTLKVDMVLAPEISNRPLKIWRRLFDVFPRLKRLRLGGAVYTLGKPCHLTELTFSPNFGNFAQSVTHLDLLDFSGVAQEHYWEVPHNIVFDKLEYLAVDLGICPYLYTSVQLELETIKHIVFYRAPFAKRFSMQYFNLPVDTLELWGNVLPSLSFGHLEDFELPEKLVWNTSCYDEKFHGKRIQHLLKAKRRSYPIFSKDLMLDTADHTLQMLTRLTFLEIDFGPLTLASWNRLGQNLVGLTTLKAVFGEDRHLELLANYWPNLECLELKHRSQVSVTTLINQLPKLERLSEFRWKSCACTQSKFTNAEPLRVVHTQCRRLKKVELPWKWIGYEDELVIEQVCRQAEFENALLRAAENPQFMDTSVADEVERIVIKYRLDRKLPILLVVLMIIEVLLVAFFFCLWVLKCDLQCCSVLLLSH